MNPELSRSIEHACARLCHEYARAVDFRDYDNFVNLFASEGVLDVGRELIGREAIQASLMRRPDELRSRHVMSNILIEPLSETSARGTAYLTLYRHLGDESLARAPIQMSSPAAVGHYEDRFVNTAQGWLFERRKLFVAFHNADLV